MAKIVKNNIDYTSTPSSASMLPYDNFNSGLDATNVQEAIDEIAKGGGSGATSLNQLSDVELTDQTVGQILKYNGYKWINTNGGGGGATTFADLTDVSLNNVQNGQVPKYNSTTQKWENADESGGDLSNYYTKSETDNLLDDKADVSDLPDMTDYYDKSETNTLLAGKADTSDVPQNLQDLDNVTVASATNGQVLKYNGTNWVNANESTGSSSFADLTDVDLSNLQNGQVAKYNSMTQKWENANESGGGSTVSVTQIQSTGTKIATISVDSVDTDLYAPNGGGGASSLDDLTDVTITSPTTNQELAYDGSGWENKTTRVELTQIEYDNLVAQGADLPDVDYYITDANGDGSQFQPVIYSTTEREIGVWVDGKPLYQKTTTLTNITITVSGGYSYDISSWGVDTVVKNPEGFITLSSDTDLRTLPFGILGNYSADVTSTRSAVQFRRKGGDLTCDRVVFTLTYTKTTDTAGSGTWTPQGVPAKHYSFDEHIIGTWVDNSTIYEKTYNLTGLSYPNNAWTNNILGTSGITILDFEGYFMIQPNNARYSFPSFYRADTTCGSAMINTSLQDLDFFNNMGYTISTVVVTIRYTKSS